MSGKAKKNIPTIPSFTVPKRENIVVKNSYGGQGNNNVSFGITKWAPVAVLVFTGLLYYKALSGGLTIIDDDFYITKNPFLRDFSLHGVKAIFTSFYQTNYHPLTTLTFFFEYNWFGLDPLPYHLLNVLLHLVNTWLVFKVVEQLSGKRLTAIIVCILFAIHPLHVESVAWISERKDVLYSMFYLSALLYYLRYLDSRFQTKNLITALLLFLASLFSKSAAVTLPVLLIVIDIYKGRKLNTKSLTEKVPFLLLSLFFGILAILSQRSGGAINDYASSYSFINKLFIFTSALSFYFIKLIAPSGFSILHYSPYILGGTLRWYYYLSLPFLLIIGWLVARRSSFRKEMIFGVCFFLVTISVMLQIIPVGSAYVAERYTYISYIGLFYIIGQWVSDVAINKWRNIVIGVFAVFVIVYSYQTWDRIGVWKDDTLLFNDLVDSNPDIYSSYLFRADLRKTGGDLQGALEDYTKSITLNPEFGETYFKRARTYDALGNIPAAISDYDKAIQMIPDFTEAYNSRGWDNFQSGKARAAVNDFNKAIALDANYAEAYNNRGWVYYQAGDIKSAIPDFSKAIALLPNFDKPYYNRAEIKSKTGDFIGAIEDYNILLKLHPDDGGTYYRRGMAFLSMKNNKGACADWNKAIELGNKDALQMAGQYCR